MAVSSITFDIQIKTVEYKGNVSEYVNIEITKGKTKWNINNFGHDSTFDVLRTVNGKRSAISSPMGKVFWSWEEVCENYKSIGTELREHSIDVQIYQSLIAKTNK